MLLWALLLAFPSIAIASEFQVLRVIDGDTIDIEYNGTKEQVRLLCVDTPESVHPDIKQNIPMGKVASDHVMERLSGKSVDLEFEGDRLRGNYGRLLAYVIVDGQNFNLELVRQGLFPYYVKYGKSPRYDAEFKDAEKQARKEGLNIWGDPASSSKYLRLKSKWGQSQAQAQDATPAIGPFVESAKSNKYHRPDCRWAGKIKASNLITFASREDAQAPGYVSCKTCRP